MTFNKEILILNALIEVKTARGISKVDALKEAQRQRYIEPLTIEYLDDIYKASRLLYRKYKWFREAAHKTTLALQKGAA